MGYMDRFRKLRLCFQNPNTIKGLVAPSDDYCFYIDAAELKRLRKDWSKLNTSVNRKSLEVTLRVKDGDASAVGRAVVCPCFQGHCASVTIRVKKKDRKGTAKPTPAIELPAWMEHSPYRPESQTKEGCCLSAETLCDALYDAVFASKGNAPRQGLLLVTGRTGSLKSTTARGLIYRVLKDAVARKPARAPHLITHEDPIEQYLFEAKQVSIGTFGSIDYTPRDLKSGDTSGLDETLENALRQTPTVVYVGEIREAADWRLVQHFAGTGHLIVATAHAGSLSETLQRLFSFAKADTPSRRGEVADSLCAVIHQSSFTVREGSGPNYIAVVPTLWRHTRSGVASLVADGLGAVVPGRPSKGREAECSTLGKAWFADRTSHNFGPPEVSDIRQRERLAEQFRRECQRRDLEGI